MRSVAFRAAVLSLGTALVIAVIPGASWQTLAARAGEPDDSQVSAEPETVGMLAYATAGEGQRTEVFSVRTDGSERRQLTTSGGYDPAWSPDGTRIAFQRRNAIWLMNASGGQQERLVRGFSPAWAPDGQRLSYVCNEGIDLCSISLQDGTVTIIVTHSEDWPAVANSTWSPDGTSIAFTRISAQGDEYTSYRQLFRVNADGSELTAIENTYPWGTLPDWSPDGSRILYTDVSSTRGGENSGDIWSIRPDGTSRTRVTSSPGTDYGASWSPDGKQIAMSSAARLYLHQAGIWIMNVDGTRPALVVRAGGVPSWRPAFSAAAPPDVRPGSAAGKPIAYVAATDRGYDLFTVLPSGRSIRRLTSGGRVFEPAWSADHTRIVYGWYAKSGFGGTVRLMDVRTRRVQHLGGLGSTYEFSPAWSPNGRQLVWGNGTTLVVMNLQTGERTRVPLDPDICCPISPIWSPDGRWIAFSGQSPVTGRRDLMIVRAQGGRARRVIALPGEAPDLDWSPNGRRISFTHGTDWKGKTSILSVRLDGTGLRQLIDTPGLDLDAAWSPSGARLAFYSDGPHPYGSSPQPGLWISGPQGQDPHVVLRDRTIAYVDW